MHLRTRFRVRSGVGVGSSRGCVFLTIFVCSLSFCSQNAANGAPLDQAESYAINTKLPIAKVFFKTENDIQKFNAFHRSNNESLYYAAFNDLFLTQPTTRGPTSVLLPHTLHNRTIAFFKKNSLNYRLNTVTLQQALRRQPDATKRALMYESVRKITGHFPRYSEIMKWMESLAAAFPDLVHLTDIGRSYESRRLVVIKIGSSSKHKRMVFVESGIHAREWLVPATCIWIIDRLVHDYAYGVPEVRKMLDEIYDFGFIILSNPDGYEYTHTTNRFWRRTRSVRTLTTCSLESCTPSQLRNVTCIGADANRNWDIHFNEIGTSDVCSDTYPGPKAFSEVEMEKLAEYIAAESFSIRFYLALHSYGQMWFIPPGYSRLYLSSHNLMLKFSSLAVDAIKNATGLEYALGTHAELLYMVSGSSADWVIENGVAFAATVELPPIWRKDGFNLGTRGFLAKASEVAECGNHMLIGLMAIANALHDYDNEFR